MQQEVNNSNSITTKSWLVLVLLSIVWGSSFILIKKALIVFSPLQVAGLRVFLSSLAFLPIVLYLFSEIDWSKWKYFLAVGLTGSAIPAVLFSTAQTQISSSLAGVLNSLTPLFTLILGVWFFKKEIIKFQVIGIIVGFIGASFLILGGESGEIRGNIMYGSLIVLATIFYALNANAIHVFFDKTRPIIISSLSFSLLGPVAGIYLYFSGFFGLMTSHEYGYNAFAAVCFLALVGTVIATVIFFQLIKDTGPIFSSSVAFLIPMVALAWGLFDGETIYFLQGIGMCAILMGIYLIRK